MLPYHQSISTSPFNPILPFTQISTRTLISFERIETLEKKIEYFKLSILLLRIPKSLIPLFFLQNSTSTSIFIQFSSTNFISREILSMKIIFTRFEKTKRNILQANYTRNSLLTKMPGILTWKGGSPQRVAPKDFKRILPISRLLIRSLSRAFISSFLFRGFSLNVETASHYRSFVARDVNKRDVETRKKSPQKKFYSSRENWLSVTKLILIHVKIVVKIIALRFLILELILGKSFKIFFFFCNFFF